MSAVLENPAALREVATAVRSLADELCGYTAEVIALSQNLGYEGPSGDRYREVLQQSHNGLHAEAIGLYRLATRLEAGADEAERRIIAERAT